MSRPRGNPLPSEARHHEEMLAITALGEAKTAELLDQPEIADNRMRAAHVHSNLAVSHGLDQLDTTIKAIARAFWPERMKQQREKAS